MNAHGRNRTERPIGGASTRFLGHVLRWSR